MTTSNDSLSLVNKIAIITGSGKENGIGAGIALALASAGARVVINYVSGSTAPRAAEVAVRIQGVAGQGGVIVVQADISTTEGTQKLVDETLKGFGADHIDILVNNAAAGKVGPFLATSHEDIVDVFDVNVFGKIKLIKAVIPHMPHGGRIINIGSIATKLGLAGNPIYGASKAALDALTFSISQELGREKGITINTIAPGPVMTDSFHPDGPPQMQEFKNMLVSMTRAEARPGTVEDIADVAVFLASEKSRWITGQWISVSGGITGM